MYGIEVSGELELSGFYNRLQGLMSSDTLRHEREHVRIYRDNWNNFVSAVNPYEGKYCEKACREAAVQIFKNASALHQAYSKRDQAQFHIRENQTVEAERQRVNEAQAIIDSKLEALNAAKQKYKDAGCPAQYTTAP